MLATRFLSRIRSRICNLCMQQRLQCSTKPPEPNLGKMSTKYQAFREEDSEVILDIYEERLKKTKILKELEEQDDVMAGLNLERGKHGVFDVEELVEVLGIENGEDIFVAKVPQEFKYVDYICLVNGKSSKHMEAIAQFVRKVYKKKRHEYDLIPRLEGANSKDWMAIDLGNIALHIFSREARKTYDLDSLWSLGPKFDYEYNKKDPISEMLEKHSVYLRDLQPR